MLALDLAAAGWWMVWEPQMVIWHHPSTNRDSRRRRQLGIRNTLWTLWLRRPLGHALVRSATILVSAPPDLVTLSAVGEALRALPRVIAHRQPVPPEVERGLRLLEHSQDTSPARRYVD